MASSSSRFLVNLLISFLATPSVARQVGQLQKLKIEKNQTFFTDLHSLNSLTRNINEFAGPISRHLARATQLLSKKFCKIDEPLATLPDLVALESNPRHLVSNYHSKT